MSNLILPQKHKLTVDEEKIVLPTIICSFCHKETTTGMHQTRLKLIKPSETKVVDGITLYKPPVMKQIDYYMCPLCIEKGTKWPGERP